jgi:hypothetical protein
MWLEHEPATQSERTWVNDEPFEAIFRFSPDVDRKLYRQVGLVSGEAEWRLSYCGTEPSFRLRIETRGEMPVFRIVDESYGFPAGLRVPVRPSHLMASSFGDRVFVTDAVALEL